MADELVERIVSLSRVYDLARKEPGSKGIDLQELISSILEPHRSSHDLTLEGPAVLVDSEALNTLTLIAHELTTNAAKHGALSLPEGSLKVSWRIGDNNMVELHWREKTPGFEIPECQPGFGTMLIESGVRQLRGTFSRSFAEDGADIQFALNVNE